MNFLERIWESGILRLDNVKRFNGKLSLQEESVSTHSFWVATFCLLLIEKISYDEIDMSMQQIEAKKLFTGIILKKALLHDVPEIDTGDLIFPVKYSFGQESENIKKNLHRIEIWIYENLFRFLFSHKVINHYLLDPKEEAINNFHFKILEFEQKFIKLADWMSCYYKSRQESSLGNVMFTETEKLSLEKIRILIHQLKEIFEKYLSMDEEKKYSFIDPEEFDDLVDSPIKLEVNVK